jgi:Zn-dependent protease/CBS domain-containing protein
LFGIPLRLHFSWFFIFILVTWALAASYFPSVYPDWSVATAVIASIITSLLFFASVLLHELMHSVVARAAGIPVKSITLFIFGGVSQITEEPAKPQVELKMAIAGPLTSLLLGGVFWAVYYLVPESMEHIIAVSFWLGLINLTLGVFNLLPGFPLDGGRVLRAILWWRMGDLRRATHWAANAGRGVSFLFIFGGVWLLFAGYWFNGLWLAFIGWFLGNAAVGSYRQLNLMQMLQGHAVSEAMSRECRSVPPDISLEELVNRHILSSGGQCFVVTEGGAIRGLITLRDVKAVPREEWEGKRVSDAMVSFDKLKKVRPGEDLAGVLKIMTEADINQLPVVDGGQVVGLISRDSLLAFINIRDKLGV